MDSLRDVSKEIKAALYDRVGDPFIGSFIFFALTWNWRFVYTLLRPGDETTEKTITNAVSHLNWCSLGIPATTTFIYVFFYSWVRQWIVSYWYARQTTSANTKRLAEKKKLLTEEEGKHLQSLADEETKKLTAIIDLQAREISSFKDFVVGYAGRTISLGRGNATIQIFPSNGATSRNGIYALNSDGNRLNEVEFSNERSQRYVYVFERIGMGIYVVGAVEGSVVPAPEAMILNPQVKLLRFLSTKQFATEEEVAERLSKKQPVITLAQFSRIDDHYARFERVTTQ